MLIICAIVVGLFIFGFCCFCIGYLLGKLKVTIDKILANNLIKFLKRILTLLNYDAVSGDPEAIAICAKIDNLLLQLERKKKVIKD